MEVTSTLNSDENHVSKSSRDDDDTTRCPSKNCSICMGSIFHTSEACLLRCRTSSHHYGSAIWYAPLATKDAKKDMAGKLEVIPNRYLRLLSGAYKATSIEVLQAETMITSMQEYLDLQQAKARAPFTIEGQAAFIKKQCKKVTAKVRQRGTNTKPETPGRRMCISYCRRNIKCISTSTSSSLDAVKRRALRAAKGP